MDFDQKYLLTRMSKELIELDGLRLLVAKDSITIFQLDSAADHLENTIKELQNVVQAQKGMNMANEALFTKYKEDAARAAKQFRKLRRQRTWERIGEGVAIILILIVAI